MEENLAPELEEKEQVLKEGEEEKEQAQDGKIRQDQFEPEQEDLILKFGEHKQRLIFGGTVAFSQKEMDQILVFQQWLKDSDLDIPENYDYREMFRFLQSYKFDNQNTYNGIMAHHEFFKVNLPVDEELLKKYYDVGLMYFYKRDKRMRPILIIDMATLINEIDEKDFLPYTLMIIENVIQNHLVPGKIENWIVIVDCNDIGLTQIPVSKLQIILGVFQQNYPGRLYKLFAINVGFLLRTIWTVISGFIDSFTENKIKIYSDDYIKDLFELVDIENLEKKFWGVLENKTEKFFPPELD
ncbi:unnamed protein product [Moneuplotes crassus]|uniref:CRAL-TRIO domain-containing protein n=1 Tax=Euplotes crassus TaxID=5936 RepID=A0AAD1XL16_EUPCR|nr:unnamed protein product [Moneuplotes crassus]